MDSPLRTDDSLNFIPAQVWIVIRFEDDCVHTRHRVHHLVRPDHIVPAWLCQHGELVIVVSQVNVFVGGAVDQDGVFGQEPVTIITSNNHDPASNSG